MCQRLVSSTLQTHQAGFVTGTHTKTSVAVKSHQIHEEAVTKLLDDCNPRLTNETPRTLIGCKNYTITPKEVGRPPNKA